MQLLLLVVQSVGHAVAQAVGQAFGQAVGHAVEQAVGQAFGQVVGQAVEQAVGQCGTNIEFLAKYEYEYFRKFNFLKLPLQEQFIATN